MRFAVLFVAMVASAMSAFGSDTCRPNIVVFLADDLGYGSVGCFGAPRAVVPTPHIDRLAEEGRRFTEAYTPSSLCTPTRYGLLTGRYCWRTSLKKGVLGPLSPLLIEPSRPTIASMLSEAGYATAVIGKWHLGFGTQQRKRTDLMSPLSPGPLQVGFDFFFGIPQNHGEWWGVYVENESVWGLRSTKYVECPQPSYYGPAFMGFDAPQRDDWTAQKVLTDKAVDWIGHQSPDRPFFLYFASAAVHEPVTPTEAASGRSRAGLYGDWICDVDISVGRIVEALEEAGIMDDTLFIFTSDNGAHQVDRPRPHREVLPPYTFVLDAVWDAQQKGLKPNGDLRGSKGGIHEGGFRVPFVARWPSHIPANSASDRTICLVDVIATIAELLGVSPPNHDGDSHSFLPHLLGKPVDDSGRDALVLHSGNGTFAVRKGPWKWIEGVPANVRRRVTNQAAQELYNLVEDPAETRNVVSQRSEIAREMATILNQIRGE